MVDRATTIRALVDEYEKPAPGPRGVKYLDENGEPYSEAEQMVSWLEASKGDIRIGTFNKVLAQLPPEERAEAMREISAYHEQKELGRHGDPEGIARELDSDPEILEAAEKATINEFITRELVDRRGNDGSRELPELTRRDYLDAAFDAGARIE